MINAELNNDNPEVVLIMARLHDTEKSLPISANIRESRAAFIVGASYRAAVESCLGAHGLAHDTRQLCRRAIAEHNKVC